MKPAEQSEIPVHRRFSDDVIRITKEVFRDGAAAALEALSQPVHRYYVRCNTLKISPGELVERLNAEGFEAHRHHTISEALYFEAQGPFEVPTMNKRIVVDKKTAESTLQGANVYAPGVLDCGPVHAGEEVNIVSEFGEVLGAGRARMSANEILTFRRGLAVDVTHRRFNVPKIRETHEYSEGLLYPQSLAAMATTRVLDPQPGDTVLDINCAPGGKLSHIGQLMGGSGRILGFDRNANKIETTRQTIKTLGCRNATVSIHDTRYLADDLSDLKADRVLVDPSCTALGIRPKVYDRTTMTRVRNLAAYQKQFIKPASQLAKDGGTIVYSVCTFSIEECEEVVDYGVRECGLHLADQAPFLGVPSVTEPYAEGSACQRFNPHTHEIGYFIAKFRR